jgi:sialic acid synthase SpsE
MKRVLPIEADVRTLSRQSLVTLRDLPAGHVIRREDLTIKRPGTGVEPWRLESVIGRRLAGDVAGDMPLRETDLVGLPTVAAA